MRKSKERKTSVAVGSFLIGYFSLLMCYRYYVRGVAGTGEVFWMSLRFDPFPGLYDLLWLCNQALLVSGVA